MIKKVFMIGACWISFNISPMFNALKNPFQLFQNLNNNNKLQSGGFNRLKSLEERKKIIYLNEEIQTTNGIKKTATDTYSLAKNTINVGKLGLTIYPTFLMSLHKILPGINNFKEESFEIIDKHKNQIFNNEFNFYEFKKDSQKLVGNGKNEAKKIIDPLLNQIDNLYKDTISLYNGALGIKKNYAEYNQKIKTLNEASRDSISFLTKSVIYSNNNKFVDEDLKKMFKSCISFDKNNLKKLGIDKEIELIKEEIRFMNEYDFLVDDNSEKLEKKHNELKEILELSNPDCEFIV